MGDDQVKPREIITPRPSRKRGAWRSAIASISSAFSATSGLPKKRERSPTDKLLERAEAASGYVAVAIVGIQGGWPCRIAVSKSPRDIFKIARKWNHEPVTVHYLAWCIDRERAELLAQILETILEVHQRPAQDGWYDLDATLIASQLDRAAEKAGVQIFDELQRRQRLEMIVERAITRIAEELEGGPVETNVVPLPHRPRFLENRD